MKYTLRSSLLILGLSLNFLLSSTAQSSEIIHSLKNSIVNNDLDSFKALISSPGFDANMSFKTDSLLIRILRYNRAEFAEFLLKTHTVDVNRKNIHGETALSVAAELGYGEIVRLLLKSPNIAVNPKEDDVGALHVAAAKGHIDIVKMLLGVSSLDVNSVSRDSLYSEDKTTALVYAIKSKKTEIAKLLIKSASADVNKCGKARSIEYSCALPAAVHTEDYEIVEMLLAIPGTSLSIKGKALESAALNGQVEMVEILLRNGDLDSLAVEFAKTRASVEMRNLPNEYIGKNDWVTVINLLTAYQERLIEGQRTQ